MAELRVTMQARLPVDLAEFLEAESKRYGSSMNSEIVRAVRERMERVKEGETA